MCIAPMDTNNESLLELAANNNVEDFKKSIDRNLTAGDKPGIWYCRQKCTNLITLDQRTPLMVAATYGSLDVLRLILATSNPDVNRVCGEDRTTALHCAVSGGSENVVEVVTLLMAIGADVGIVDANGNRPADVITVSPKLCGVKIFLEGILGKKSICLDKNRSLRISTSPSSLSSPPLSSSPDMNGDSLSTSSDSTSSPISRKDGAAEKKEYPVDPSFPDIKNDIYSTDDFRMFSFKVCPCSRAYSHDWTECPFVHPGENARRRDPRKYHYSCVPCPEFRKGACRRGDLCEYAHGVFECWLHPAQYRTRLCKDGPACARRVCFFAHKPEELRPLYVSTGSAVPSPRATASAMEMAAAMLSMLPGSPSSQNCFGPLISPPGNIMGSFSRHQPNVPTLHLSGSNNFQSSRLRASLIARDMPVEDMLMLSDSDVQELKDWGFPYNQASFRSLENQMGRPESINPSNLDELFSAEISSSLPRYNSDQGKLLSPSRQFQQQSVLSPIRTNYVLSQLTVDTQQISEHNSFLQASLGVSSPRGMSPRGVDAHSPLSNRLSQLSQQDKLQQLENLSSRDLGSVPAPVGSPVNSTWTKWGSPSGKVDWGVNGEELGQFRHSTKVEPGSSRMEPDVSWVQSLVSPPEAKEKPGCDAPGLVSAGDNANSNGQLEEHAVIGAWLKQMQLDQMVAN